MHMNLTRNSVISIALGCLHVFLIAAATFLYPNDWPLPLWLAAVLSPLLGIRLGLAGAVSGVLICISLVFPVLIWRSIWTLILAILGICLWLFSGYMVGGLLYV